MAVQPDGKILVFGFGRWDLNVSDHNPTVVRFNADGSVDTDFGTGGFASIDVNLTSFAEMVHPLIIQPDGKILFAAQSQNPEYDLSYAVFRFNEDGTPDLSFSDDGLAVTMVSGTLDYSQSVAYQPDGKNLVCGQSVLGGFYDLTVLRYTANGLLDETFSEDGIFTYELSEDDDMAKDMKVLPDGDIMVFVQSSADDFELALLRLNSDGILDNQFDGDGVATFTFVPILRYPTSLAVQEDGKYVGAVSADTGSGYNPTVVRFNSDGTLDTSFGIDGITTVVLSDGFDIARDLVLQDDGKFLVVGTANADFGIVTSVLRYNSDGSLDETFGEEGVVLTSEDVDTYHGESIAIQADGNILAA
ncbi:MAG: hypothetical protein SH856_11730 [Flavobacteriales bacterium]|nr:hypothetical protein [Flavobacteriales bacterium]